MKTSAVWQILKCDLKKIVIRFKINFKLEYLQNIGPKHYLEERCYAVCRHQLTLNL